MPDGVGKYNSIAEIVADPHGPALAYAQDMNYTDWCNFNIKNFVIRERVLNQVVHVNIDGVQTPLTNPDTNQPMKYGDFVTDRSGPKFSGYLNEQPGTEYLQSAMSSTERAALIDAQREKTLEYCKKNELPVPPPEELDQALKMFDKLHNNQRKLSDFDLTAQDTGLLERAVANAVRAQLDPEHQQLLDVSPQLASAIGKTAWQEGGAISTEIVAESLDVEIPSQTSYADKVKATMTHPNDKDYIAPGKPGHDAERAFTHMLIEDVGKTVRAEYLDFYQATNQQAPVFYQNDSSGVPDTFYGLGIPFNEAAIKSITTTGEMTLSTHHDDIEIGDIICDNSSIFGKVFNENQNFAKVCEQMLEKGITTQQLEEAKAVARESSSTQSEFFSKALDALKENSTLTPDQKKVAEEGAKQFATNQQFIASGSMFEEAGKKEAQSQLFKSTGNTKKLIGNISDTGAFMAGVAAAANDDSNPEAQAAAKAHQQMTVLSTLVNVARWGIDQVNHAQVGETHSAVKPESFQQSLNGRSYTAENSTGIREQLGWANIPPEAAQQRLSQYQEGFAPVWQAVKENPPFFEAVDAYKVAKNELKAAEASGDTVDIAEARSNFQDKTAKLHEAVEELLADQMPELSAKIDGLTSAQVSRASIVGSLVNQIDEAVEFGQNRVLIDQKRATAAAEAKAQKEAHASPEHPKPIVAEAAPKAATTPESDFLASLAALSAQTAKAVSQASESISAKVADVAKSTSAEMGALADKTATSLTDTAKATNTSVTQTASEVAALFKSKMSDLKQERAERDSPGNDQENTSRMGLK